MDKGDLYNDDDDIDDFGREAEMRIFLFFYAEMQVFEDDHDDSDVCEYDQNHGDSDEDFRK